MLETLTFSHENSCSGGYRGRWFQIWDRFSQIQDGGSNMADLCWKNRLFPRKVPVRGYMVVADFKSGVNFQKFKMADPIWRTYVKNIDFLARKFVFGGISGSLISNFRFKLTCFFQFQPFFFFPSSKTESSTKQFGFALSRWTKIF